MCIYLNCKSYFLWQTNKLKQMQRITGTEWWKKPDHWTDQSFFIFQLTRRQVAFELVSKIPTLLRGNKSDLGSFSFANAAYRDTSFEDHSFRQDKRMSMYPENFQPDKRMSVCVHINGSPPVTPPPFAKRSRPPLHLRGQMKFIKDWNKILYICSPLWVFRLFVFAKLSELRKYNNVKSLTLHQLKWTLQCL